VEVADGAEEPVGGVQSGGGVGGEEPAVKGLPLRKRILGRR
jgi:hypothetical protein